MMQSSKNRHRKLVITYFTGVLISLAALGLCVSVAFYIVDPLQFFHKSYLLPENMLSKNMREQAIGMINNYDYDSIILGSSMLENTSAEEASRKLGGKFINISVRASDFYERSFVLKNALRHDIKNVVYSLDHFFLESRMGDESYPLDNWIGLYGNNPLRYLIHYATRENFLNLFKKNKGLSEVDLDYPVAWKFQPEFASSFGGLSNWVKNMNQPHMKLTVLEPIINESDKHDLIKCQKKSNPYAEDKMFSYIDKYLLDFVKKYPDTNFYFIFPPYCRLTYSKWLKFAPEQFFAYLKSIKYFVDKSNEFANMKIYGFEDYDFLDDIKNYADPYHYHPRYNSWMLDNIKDDKKLNIDMIDNYLEAILQKAENYDLENFVNTTKKMLKENKLIEN